MTLESLETVGQHLQGAKVVWCQNLSLDDREVNLDLIEPAGMDGTMNHLEIGVTALQAFYTALTPVGGAIVHYTKYASGAAIGILRHDLRHQPVKGSDPAFGVAAHENGPTCAHEK